MEINPIYHINELAFIVCKLPYFIALPLVLGDFYIYIACPARRRKIGSAQLSSVLYIRSVY
jgi:hypothetical protein